MLQLCQCIKTEGRRLPMMTITINLTHSEVLCTVCILHNLPKSYRSGFSAPLSSNCGPKLLKAEPATPSNWLTCFSVTKNFILFWVNPTSNVLHYCHSCHDSPSGRVTPPACWGILGNNPQPPHPRHQPGWSVSLPPLCMYHYCMFSSPAGTKGETQHQKITL